MGTPVSAGRRLLAWIYAHGVEPGSWLPQGIRFGIAIALLTVVPWYLIY